MQMEAKYAPHSDDNAVLQHTRQTGRPLEGNCYGPFVMVPRNSGGRPRVLPSHDEALYAEVTRLFRNNTGRWSLLTL